VAGAAPLQAKSLALWSWLVALMLLIVNVAVLFWLRG
jgi:hypothetical protein